MSTTEQVLTEALDELTRRYTAFDSFEALLTAPGGYRPGFDVRKEPLRILANEYDQAQAARGDVRRASRMFDRPKWVSFMYPGPETKYLPALRINEIEARLLVEAAIFGDERPDEHAAVMGCYIVALDRDEAMEAERQRRLPVPRVQDVAAAVYVEAAVLYLPITRAEAHNLACYIVTETAARTMVRP